MNCFETQVLFFVLSRISSTRCAFRYSIDLIPLANAVSSQNPHFAARTLEDVWSSDLRSWGHHRRTHITLEERVSGDILFKLSVF
jgi:hypothetical protein